MCPDCTAERTRVIECGRHELEKVGDGDVGGLREILGGKGGDGVGRLCAVCVGGAGYVCCGGGAGDGAGAGGGGAGGPGNEARGKEGGCGLALCERCAVRLVGEFDGGLEGLVEAMMVENEGGMGFGVRADVEMLLGWGEVGRRVLGR